MVYRMFSGDKFVQFAQQSDYPWDDDKTLNSCPREFSAIQHMLYLKFKNSMSDSNTKNKTTKEPISGLEKKTVNLKTPIVGSGRNVAIIGIYGDMFIIKHLACKWSKHQVDYIHRVWTTCLAFGPYIKRCIEQIITNIYPYGLNL